VIHPFPRSQQVCRETFTSENTTITVVEIQRALLARGYDLGLSRADSDAGPRAIAAETAFQREAGLVAESIAGPKTRSAIQ
jgi:peptidoglycan hydrolase-like protein with peptidoglycan-binding domain